MSGPRGKIVNYVDGFSLTGAGVLIGGALAVGSGVTPFTTLKRV